MSKGRKQPTTVYTPTGRDTHSLSLSSGNVSTVNPTRSMCCVASWPCKQASISNSSKRQPATLAIALSDHPRPNEGWFIWRLSIPSRTHTTRCASVVVVDTFAVVLATSSYILGQKSRPEYFGPCSERDVEIETGTGRWSPSSVSDDRDLVYDEAFSSTKYSDRERERKVDTRGTLGAMNGETKGVILQGTPWYERIEISID